ncbi:hypothetical protein SCHPADRAFT_936175 [Schizopora paradoxa]|uniref:Uncharacterized protein n=1 Tax=Schizopora paradoxa TaxID=27342 RepID=A0A0H2S3E2_9AGAM|nr:hypothetical protein SCHPADRAFT_936175 [Schizopora paradoxa]
MELSLLTKYERQDARAVLQRLDRRGILGVANLEATLSHFARAMLREDVVVNLSEAGIPSPNGFYEMLGQHDAVISGSFVPSFLDPELARSWTTEEVSVGDVDVYIGKGKLDIVLNALADLPGADMEILERHAAPPPTVNEDGTVSNGGRDLVFYTNTAIHAMASVRFMDENGKVGYMDVVESKSASAFLPIVRFNLTHLRAGLTFDGYVNMHPTWSEGRRTFASEHVQTPPTDALNDLMAQGLRYTGWLDKYRRRGYDVRDEGVVKGIKQHECFSSVDCPLTTRNTCDEGVQYIAYSERGAIEACSGPPRWLRDPVVYWRHGGRCEWGGEASATAKVYDSEGVSDDPSDGN